MEEGRLACSPKACLGRELERRFLLELSGLTGVAGQQRDGACGKQEEGADQDGQLESFACRVRDIDDAEWAHLTDVGVTRA